MPEHASRAIALAAEQNGRIDILCNNAAYLGDVHSIVESTPEEWSKCINIGLMGTHYFTKETLPYMIKQKKGSIVNVVSIQALAGMMTSRGIHCQQSGIAWIHAQRSVRLRPGQRAGELTVSWPNPNADWSTTGRPTLQWQCDNTVLGRVGYAEEVA